MGYPVNRVINISYWSHALGMHMMYISHCNIAIVSYIHTLCILKGKQSIKCSCNLHQCYLHLRLLTEHVQSTLLYTHQSQTLYSSHTRWLNWLHLHYLRCIQGISWKDHNTNTKAMECCNMQSIYTVLY